MSDTYDFDADRMTGETRGVITRAEALLANVEPREGNTTLSTIIWGDLEDMVHDSPNVRFVDAAPDLVRDLLAEVKRLRAIPAPDGYWWVTREDADGNEVSRELRPLDAE
jgi:hypothetical protein